MIGRRGLRLAALAFALAAALGAGVAARAAPPRSYLDLPLAEALADLQSRGLRIIYSSDLVRPEMRVVQEPTASWLHDVLQQLLAPHGLTVRVGPGGSLLVVRAGPAPVTVRIRSPQPGEVTVGEVDVEAEVESRDPVRWVDFFVNGWPAARVREAPYHARVMVPDGPATCRITALAVSERGGRGSASVSTRRVVHEDRLEVALRHVYVDVDQRRGAPPLAAGDFELYEGGVRQQVATFERGATSLSALLLIDASESMRGESLRSAFAAARAFLDRLGPEDEAAVMVFADRVLAITPFGAPEPDLLESVERASAAGGTAITDHLYAALSLLDDRPGRRMVVLLSDGADVLSVLSAEDLMWKVRRSDTTLYWIRLIRPGDHAGFSSAWRDVAANRRERDGLIAAVAESGGRTEPLVRPDQLAQSFTALLDEVRRQYVLGYYPRDLRHDGSWRPVEVRLNAGGARLRYRSGWVDHP
jgi:Ca-activated chloride channel family protein